MNTTISRGILTALGFLGCGCGTKIAETATKPNAVVTEAGIDAAQPASCGTTLASRLSITTIDVNDDIRYKREGYDYIPADARLAYGVSPSGNGYIAWTNDSFSSVHVTPLTALQTRLAPDVVFAGHDIGGLYAYDDGFALLLSRDDPGQQVINTNQSSNSTTIYGYAAVLLKYSQGRTVFEAPLTGTSSIAPETMSTLQSCVERMDGRLAFNGSKYGAYFTVHGCGQVTSPPDGYATFYADRLTYVDDQGLSVAGGWSWGGCQIDEDLRLLPEASSFSSLCVSTNSPNAGVNVVSDSIAPVSVATDFAVSGFCSSQFGSVVKQSDGSYLVVWLSRGGSSADGTVPLRPTNDIAMLHLAAAPSYAPTGAITWVMSTDTINEMNLHFAAYGSDRFLITWDSVENFNCKKTPNSVSCFGDYTGTHFRLMDSQGRFLTPDETMAAPPNSRDDLIVFPNKDVGWAFVPDSDRNYRDFLPLASQNFPKVPLVAAKRQISIARLIYCPAQ